MKLGDYKGRKVTEPDFWKKKYWFGDTFKKVSKLAQNQTLWYISEKRLQQFFLVFGLKFVLNMTFNFSETYFSEKIAIWRHFTSKSSKNCQTGSFGPSLDFGSLVFLDFAHNDRWTWCLVAFLQFTGPVNVFLFSLKLDI